MNHLFFIRLILLTHLSHSFFKIKNRKQYHWHWGKRWSRNTKGHKLLKQYKNSIWQNTHGAVNTNMPSLLLFAMIFQEEIYLHKFPNQTSSSFSFLILKTHRQSQARLARLALFLLTCKPFMQQSQHFVQTLVFFLLFGPVFKSLRQLSLGSNQRNQRGMTGLSFTS